MNEKQVPQVTIFQVESEGFIVLFCTRGLLMFFPPHPFSSRSPLLLFEFNAVRFRNIIHIIHGLGIPAAEYYGLVRHHARQKPVFGNMFGQNGPHGSV